MEKKITAIVYILTGISVMMLLPFTSATGQVKLSGPVCVRAGQICQYEISGSWDSASTIQVCINGGKLTEINKRCYSGPPVAFVRVSWDEEQKGELTLTSGAHTDLISVSTADTLHAGFIQELNKIQLKDTSELPGTIVCSPATGGSCSPVYQYQWQESSDNLTWRSVPNATGANLVFDRSKKSPTYFRRKVYEASSGTEAFSNSAVILINDKRKSGNLVSQ